MVCIVHCIPWVTSVTPACTTIIFIMTPGTLCRIDCRAHEGGVSTCMGHIRCITCIVGRCVHAIEMACDTVYGYVYIDSIFAVFDYCRLSLIHISEPTRLGMISYAVFCL